MQCKLKFHADIMCDALVIVYAWMPRFLVCMEWEMYLTRRGNIEARRAKLLGGFGACLPPWTFLNFMLQRCDFLHSAQAIVVFKAATVNISNDQCELVSSFQWKYNYFYASGSIKKRKEWDFVWMTWLRVVVMPKRWDLVSLLKPDVGNR